MRRMPLCLTSSVSTIAFATTNTVTSLARCLSATTIRFSVVRPWQAAAAASAAAAAFVPSSIPPSHTRRQLCYYSHSSSSSNNDKVALMRRMHSTSQEGASSSLVDPYSEQAKHDLLAFYTHHNLLPLLTNDDNDNDNTTIDAVHQSLLRLTECVVSWNEKLNLVSRKECTPIDVYHKHVLPSVALLPLLVASSTSSLLDPPPNQPRKPQTDDDAIENNSSPTLRIVDVGTGGGFPGLPLALLLPRHQFTLVDSVRKKLVAVSDMASEMGLSNVRIHWGRAEEMTKPTTTREAGRTAATAKYSYHVVLGRSVTALPNFCAWIHDLLVREEEAGGNNRIGNIRNHNHRRSGNDDFEDNTVGAESQSSGGRLIYIIGGDIEDTVQSKVVSDIPIDALLRRPGNTSDKRALVFTSRGVREIAKEFLGAKRNEAAMMTEGATVGRNGQRRRNGNSVVRKNNYGGSSSSNRRKNTVAGRGGVDERGGGVGTGRNTKPARGAWSEKRNDGIMKQRGYDDFQRYES